ncbi:MAG TPA: carboxypeptidase-like regulatory domain-containing protein [Bacteroidales bacterium]|nr:carboxypeptidase-like regulatory domain-containing protein [Bacteroidales bacterium]
MNIPVLILSVLFGIQVNVTTKAPLKEEKGSRVISGCIVDSSTGEQLAGVKVMVKGLEVSVYTDFDGHFEIPGLQPASTYSLEIELISYPKKVITNISPGTVPVSIKLRGNKASANSSTNPVLPAV